MLSSPGRRIHIRLSIPCSGRRGIILNLLRLDPFLLNHTTAPCLTTVVLDQNHLIGDLVAFRPPSVLSDVAGGLRVLLLVQSGLASVLDGCVLSFVLE